MKCRCFAHRGFSGKYPENTLLAFSKALEAGCEGIELDVQLTKDKELVIIHDEKIDRTSDKIGFVKDMTYKELLEADFSYKFRGQVPFQKIPTLREYFELVSSRDIITNIELKTGIFEYLGIEKLVYDLIVEFGLKDRVIISSFNHNSVMRMKALDSELVCGFLSETWILSPWEYVKSNGAECYHPEFHMLTDSEARALKENGIKLNAFTVNEEKDICRMIELEIDGIISNYPDLVLRLLREKGLR